MKYDVVSSCTTSLKYSSIASVSGDQQARLLTHEFSRTDAAVVPAAASPVGADIATAEPVEDWEAAHADDASAAAPVEEEIKDAWDASSEVCARRLQAVGILYLAHASSFFLVLHPSLVFPLAGTQRPLCSAFELAAMS